MSIEADVCTHGSVLANREAAASAAAFAWWSSETASCALVFEFRLPASQAHRSILCALRPNAYALLVKP